jgi:hypothetical protein
MGLILCPETLVTKYLLPVPHNIPKEERSQLHYWEAPKNLTKFSLFVTAVGILSMVTTGCLKVTR